MGAVNCKGCNCDNKDKDKTEVNFDTYPTNSNEQGKIKKYFKIEENINNTDEQTITKGNNRKNSHNNLDNNNDEKDALKIDINNDNNFLNDNNNKIEQQNQNNKNENPLLKATNNINNNFANINENNNNNNNNFNNNNNNNEEINENFEQNKNLENNRYNNNNNNQMNNNNNFNKNLNEMNQNNFNNNSNTNDIKKNSISPINQSPSQTNYINTDNFTNINTKNNKSNNLDSSFQKHLSNLDIDKLNFGIETKEKENLSFEEQKLYNEAEKNLNKFYPPEKKELKQIAKKLKKISFKNFIPIKKLKKINLNDENLIIYHGELNKMINYETNAHKPQMYTSKFCVLYPKYFKYYKSKENFLRNLKPSCVINLNQITKVNMAKVRKSSTKIDHIILCNKMGIINTNKNNENVVGDLVDVNKYLYLPENRESLLIFTSSEGEEVVFKWFMIIKYFVQKNKEENVNFNHDDNNYEDNNNYDNNDNNDNNYEDNNNDDVNNNINDD